jgi:hypothetical protein
MRLQAYDAFWADYSVVRQTRRQVQPITRVESYSTPFVWKAKSDRAFDDVNHFVIGVRMRAVYIPRAFDH